MVNPHQTIEMFTGTMEDLMAVMSYEITLVKARRYSKLKQVQRKKNRLSESYQRQQTVLQENPDLLATLAPEERDGLRQKFAQFREILADNMLAIRAAHDATEKVIQAVVTDIKKRHGIGDESGSIYKPRRGYAAYTAAPPPNATSVRQAL
ncbi:MAG: hypothetical protein VX168_03250 [Pseudomonadota bacterium]|nr:hypothetical protein [Pseudomonadota bacterium]